VHSRTQALPPPATLAGAPGGTETILLIEDQADVRTLAAGILRDLGYAVLEAPSALAALQTAQDHIGDPVRLLLVGIALPDLALNQLTAALAPSVPAVRALFLSGQSDHPAPGQGSLEKPFTREALACAVRELLDRP
jgi:CheY-like chemotaxis protein